MSHIDRLATVSKILLDERVIELRQEVETLKLGIFWRDNSMFRLNEAMKIANGMHVKCGCSFCCWYNRTDLMKEAELESAFTAECRLLPWFHEVLLSHGFVMFERTSIRTFVSQGRVDLLPEMVQVEITSQRDPKSSGPLTRNVCIDLDCHLFKLSPVGNYAFGTKLWQAKSVNDPELQKLTKLISVLEAYYKVE